jgi:alpha-D-xyloside xylohydrolase
MSLPLLVRPNSVIPMGRHTDKPDYDYSDGVTLQLYSLDDGLTARVEIPSLDGKIETVFEIERKGNTIHIQRHGPDKAWNVARSGSAITRLEKHVSEANLSLA